MDKTKKTAQPEAVAEEQNTAEEAAQEETAAVCSPEFSSGCTDVAPDEDEEDGE